MHVCEFVTRPTFQNKLARLQERSLSRTLVYQPLKSQVGPQATLRVRRSFAFLRPQRDMRSGEDSVAKYILCLFASLAQGRISRGKRGETKICPMGFYFQLEKDPTIRLQWQCDMPLGNSATFRNMNI